MRPELSTALEESFDFDPLEKLTKTSKAISGNQGTIHYIPTNYPLPLSKRVLGALVGNNEPVRALPMPETKDDLQETIFSGIDYLIQNNGAASVVFFCPASITSDIQKQRGAKFVPTNQIEILDLGPKRADVYEDLTGTHVTSTETDLASFVLDTYITKVTGERAPLEKFETTSMDNGWELYLPFSAIDEVSKELQEFYLETLGFRDRNQFLSLSPEAQQNVFEVAFEDRYGISGLKERAEFCDTWSNLESGVAPLFRRLAGMRLIKGDGFSSELLELTDRGGRSFIDSIQKSYSSLFDEAEKVNLTEPDEAGDRLIQNFGIIYNDATQEEIEWFLSQARNQLSEDAIHVKGYDSSKVPDILARIDRILEHIKEMDVVTRSSIIESELESEDWIEPLEGLHKRQTEEGIEGYLEIDQIPALTEAKRRVNIELAAEKEAQTIHEMDAHLHSLPEFISEWIEFLVNRHDGNSASDVFHDAIVKKYDEFNDVVIDQYSTIRDSDEYNHISETIQPNEKLQLIVVVDSLGYTDVELMDQWGLLDSEPSVDLVYSNIPSYTPSAMASVLTGLTPEQTGIYHWTVRDGNEVLDLQGNTEKKDIDSVSNNKSLSYYLIQKQNLMTSGITRFAQQATDVELHDGFNPGDGLEDVFEELVDEVEGELRTRHKTLTGTLDIPEEAIEKRVQSLNSTFVVYLEDFDSLLHEDLSKYEFKNYYRALARFIDDLSSSLLDHLREYSYQEDFELVFAADHGKLSRYERDLITDIRIPERFNQDSLTELAELDEYHYINFDAASFTDREGKSTLAIGDVDEDLLLQRARELLEDEESPEFDGIPDEKLSKLIICDQFVLSGSKFLFGYDKDADQEEFNRYGYDLYRPSGDGVFDNPSIGLLSRYRNKNAARAHGYHGGTSISEMLAAKLTYGGDTNE